MLRINVIAAESRTQRQYDATLNEAFNRVDVQIRNRGCYIRSDTANTAVPEDRGDLRVVVDKHGCIPPNSAKFERIRKLYDSPLYSTLLDRTSQHCKHIRTKYHSCSGFEPC